MTYLDPLNIVGVAHQTPKGPGNDLGIKHVLRWQDALPHVGAPLILFWELI
jgi:hypothetical protein